MGRFFQTFDEAWANFLAREEPLESFFDTLPADPDATLDLWLALPSEAVRRAAAALQLAFAHLDWIAPTPAHFLHVTLGDPPPELPLELRYGGVNCFHEAVIVEVECPALAGLPHLTIGYVREPRDAGPLRDALVPLRGAGLGAQTVEEVALCRIPASRTNVLSPWRVLRRLGPER